MDDQRLLPDADPDVPGQLLQVWLVPAGDERPHAITRAAANYAAYDEARVLLNLGRADLARRQFAAVATAQSRGYLAEAAALGEAEAAEAAKDYAGAARIYERLLTRSPMAPDEVWFRLGKANVASGNRARAIDAFRHVYQQFLLGRFAVAAATALTDLEVLEPLAPGNARYRFEVKRADLLFDAKRYDEARVALDRVRKHATGTERDRLDIRRAACDYFGGRYAAARSALRAVRDRGAHQAEARFFDLMAARALGEAEDFERLALDLVDRFGETQWAEATLDALATFYIQRNRDDEADLAFRRLLAAFPAGRHAARASWKVGWRAYRSGRAAEAAQLFDRAASRFPRSDYRPAYLYWAARAHEARQEDQLAAERYALVRTDYLHSYYGRLASAALARPQIPLRASSDTTPSPAAPAPDTKARALPPTADIIRTLISAGLFDEALHEVRYAQHLWGDSPALLATRAWLLHQKGDLLAGASAMKRAYPEYIADGKALASSLLAVIFPVGYWNVIRDHAVSHQLDPYLLAALIAQESGFIPDIRSRAKATGLMQLMPATAQRYARKLMISPYSPALLTRPQVNVRLGTAYFADLVREFGEIYLALASYNAGESRVRRWVSERPGLAADEFIDDIPFPETRNYVKKILGAAENYRRLYERPTVVPADPNRAIPSLASRGASVVPAALRPAPKADPPAVRSKAKPGARRSTTRPPEQKPATSPGTT